MISNRIGRHLSASRIKIAKNIGWLSAAKVLQMAFAMLVGAWVARYLGPEQYGLLNFALAFVALASSFAAFGLQGIVVRELVRKPEQTNHLLGTTFVLKLLGGLVSFFLIVVAIHIVNPQDNLAIALVTIIAIKAVLMAFGTIDLYFQATVQSKYAVIAATTGLFIGALFKIALILAEAPLVYFAIAVVLETAVTGMMLLWVYQQQVGSLILWRPSLQRAKGLLRESWILTLSSIGVVIYLKIDQIMLGIMLDTEAVGIYSAAVKLSEASYFLPIFIAASTFPTLISSREQNKAVYSQQLQKLYDLMMWLALGVIIIATAVAPFAINLLYGPAYAASTEILIIHIWASIFVYFSQVLSKWLINERLTWFSPLRQGAGALANVLLNLFLIPRYGGVGAAIATLFSYAMATYFISLCLPDTREAARMMTLALLVPARTLLQWTKQVLLF